MLRRGEITDSMSVIALLHEAVRRREARIRGRVSSPDEGAGRNAAMRRIPRRCESRMEPGRRRSSIDRVVISPIIDLTIFP